MSWHLIDHDLPTVPADRSPLVPVTTILPMPLPVPVPVTNSFLPLGEHSPGSLLVNEEDSPYYVRQVDQANYSAIQGTLRAEPGEVPVIYTTPTIIPPGSTLSTPSLPLTKTTSALPLPVPVPSGH